MGPWVGEFAGMVLSWFGCVEEHSPRVILGAGVRSEMIKKRMAMPLQSQMEMMLNSLCYSAGYLYVYPMPHLW